MFFLLLNLKNALHYQAPHSWLLSSNTFHSRQQQKEVERRTSKKKLQQRNPKEGVKDGLNKHKKVKSFYLRQHTLVSQWDVTTEWTYCSESESASLSLPLSLSLHPLTRFCRHLSPQKNKAQLDMEQCVSVRGTWPSRVYLWLWPPTSLYLCCGWCLIKYNEIWFCWLLSGSTNNKSMREEK